MIRYPATVLALLTGFAAGLVLACTGPSPAGKLAAETPADKPAAEAGQGDKPVEEASAGGKPATTVSTAGKASAKISPDLLALHESYREARRRGSVFRPTSPSLRIVDDRVVIDATASGDARALEADLVALGMRNAAAFGRIVSGELPIDAIPALDTLASLAFARPSASSHSPGPAQPPPRP